MVHMKASRGPTNRAIRDNQAQAIANFIQAATAGAEKDALVIGDAVGRMVASMDSDPGVAWGVLDGVFDQDRALLRLLAYGNRFRFRRWGGAS